MEQVIAWSTRPFDMWGDGDDGITLAFPEALAKLWTGIVELPTQQQQLQQIDRAGPGTDGSIFATQGERVLYIGPGEVIDVTQDFGGPALSDGRVVRGACGEIYVRGCPKFRRLNGTYGDLSTDDEGALPLPMAADLCGNIWSLLAADSHTRVLVWPANTREATTPGMWLDVAVPAGLWEFLLTDAAGFVWIAGPQGARRL
jgi:hypothetical protein